MNTAEKTDEILFLKNIKTGAVFRRTDILAQRSEMIPCDAEGNIIDSTGAERERAITAGEREVTKYLGNPNNGALENYSEILAGRPEMVSVNTFQEWEEWKKAHEAGEAPPSSITPTPAPSLGRKLTDAPADKAFPKDEAPALPEIEGMGAREAKTVLADWAGEVYGVVIDRRPALKKVVAECEVLLTKKTLKAMGQ